MKSPREPLHIDAHKFLQTEFAKLKGAERQKALKRLRMGDRGFVTKDGEAHGVERG